LNPLQKVPKPQSTQIIPALYLENAVIINVVHEEVELLEYYAIIYLSDLRVARR
jgi:hypothetical protein